MVNFFKICSTGQRPQIWPCQVSTWCCRRWQKEEEEASLPTRNFGIARNSPPAKIDRELFSSSAENLGRTYVRWQSAALLALHVSCFSWRIPSYFKLFLRVHTDRQRGLLDRLVRRWQLDHAQRQACRYSRATSNLQCVSAATATTSSMTTRTAYQSPNVSLMEVTPLGDDHSYQVEFTPTDDEQTESVTNRI